MEVDSIHVAAEHAKKNVKVFVPTDWQTVCSCARSRKPYTVGSLLHDQLVNFKEISKLVSSPELYKLAVMRLGEILENAV